MFKIATSYPVVMRKRRVDLVLNNISISSGNIQYKGATQIGSNVNFGSAIVEFLPSDPIQVGDTTLSGSECMLFFDDILITGDVVLTEASELIVVNRTLEL